MSRAKSDSCSRGHEFTPETTYIYPQGGRSCRICARIWSRAYKAKRLPPIRPAKTKRLPCSHPEFVNTKGQQFCVTCEVVRLVGKVDPSATRSRSHPALWVSFDEYRQIEEGN